MTTIINPYGLRNEMPGPKLFMYARDLKQAGSIVVIASSREEASRVVGESSRVAEEGDGRFTLNQLNKVDPEEWIEYPIEPRTVFASFGSAE